MSIAMETTNLSAANEDLASCQGNKSGRFCKETGYFIALTTSQLSS